MSCLIIGNSFCYGVEPTAGSAKLAPEKSEKKHEAQPDDAQSRLKPHNFKLIGGIRIKQDFAEKGLAIDFERGRIFAAGHAQRNEIHEYKLPEIGSGESVTAWPVAPRVATHERFWDTGNARGLQVRDGKLYVSTKVFYDMKPGPVNISSKDLSTGETDRFEIPSLGKGAFGGGFVKGHPTEWLIGCGGYESGQGSVAGPTCARVDGTKLLNQVNHGSMVFGSREVREPNYWPKGRVNSWPALNPVDGVGQWACDRVYGGGIWHRRGLCFWAIMGVGEIDYSRQSETFTKAQKVYLYTYDPTTYKDVEYTEWPYGAVIGQDIGPDGKIYLLIRNAWKGGRYKTGAAIHVFEIVD
ncbi:MAG: hypothetical protein R6U98_05440 [Pirellulaceae bacterium]